MIPLRERLTQLSLPIACAPLFLASGPELVTAALDAGLVAGLPRQNALTRDDFDRWLHQISESRLPDTGGVLAVNLGARDAASERGADLELCRRHGVDLIISVAGDPTELVLRAHDIGAEVLHDVTSIRFAEKAIRAGVDGLVCIGSGGGGHSGAMSHLALVPRARSMFDGIIVAAGAIASGRAVRAVEVLGADLAYVGTRFLASAESRAPTGYKEALMRASATDLSYLRSANGVPANWLNESFDATRSMVERFGDLTVGSLPAEVRPWSEAWSAGQGVELISSIEPVEAIVARMRAEYDAACAVPKHGARPAQPDRT